MTEKQRTAYWERYTEWLTFILPRLAIRDGSSRLTNESYTALLISKGLLLRSAISLQDHINHSDDEELKEMQDQIQYLKKKIHYWQNTNDIEAHQQIFNCQVNLDRLQQRILNGVKKYGFMPDLYINVDSVKKNLNDGDVAIEFIGLDRDLEASDTTIHVKDYVAFVLKSDYNNPHIVELCNSLSLSQNSSDLSYLYEAIWQPLDNELHGAKRIFFSLDGELHKLPIEYSPIPSGKIISEVYQMYRLSSTRQLALVKKQKKRFNEITIFGNVDYYNSRGNLAIPVPVEALAKFETTKSIGKCKEKRGASKLASQTFMDLTYSKQESYSVASLCQKHNINTNLYEQDNASEEVFKDISGQSPQMLLLSTHGYFIPKEKEGTCQMNIPKDKEGAEELSLEDESLSRSGFVLAGANQYLLGNKNSLGLEDGFVTARELSRMNLDNTDLVVLSACETRLGEVSSEGVIGLQRGFKRAGVNSIIMSLWKVDDCSAALFIEYFFNSYFKFKSKQKAMFEAIKQLRSTDNRRWDDPKYWAAFILLDALD